jgi:hypothetical protein
VWTLIIYLASVTLWQYIVLLKWISVNIREITSVSIHVLRNKFSLRGTPAWLLCVRVQPGYFGSVKPGPLRLRDQTPGYTDPSKVLSLSCLTLPEGLYKLVTTRPTSTCTHPSFYLRGEESARNKIEDDTQAEESSASSCEEGCGCIKRLWIAAAAKQQVSPAESNYNTSHSSSSEASETPKNIDIFVMLSNIALFSSSWFQRHLQFNENIFPGIYLIWRAFHQH